MRTVASTHATHAAIAPAGVLVDERRTLYRLAGEVFVPGAELSDKLLDHPAVRYELGRALAGHDDLTIDVLLEAARIGVRAVAGVAVVSDPLATGKLATALRIIAPAGARPEVLTEADGDRFTKAAALVDEAVLLVRELAPEMSDDLFAHLDLLAMLKSGTSGGVVSASTRYMPGLVLIDEPSTAIEVAEALVHECSHLKFFDLAMTREFLDGARAEQADHFVNSWSKVKWPLEQTFAAWHAYTALAQFSRACEKQQLSPVSLLPKAHDRAAEIGRWLLDHETDLRSDARWLLRELLDARATADETAVAEVPDGAELETVLTLVPGVRFKTAASGRAVAARRTRPLDVFWLNADSSWVMCQLRVAGATIETAAVLAAAVDEWRVPESVAIRRLGLATASLRRAGLIASQEAHQPFASKDL